MLLMRVMGWDEGENAHPTLAAAHAAAAAAAEGRKEVTAAPPAWLPQDSQQPASVSQYTSKHTYTHLLDNLVVRQRDAVAADLAIAALVDQLTHGLEVGVAPCNVGLHTLEQTERGLVNLCSQVVEGGMCDVKQR